MRFDEIISLTLVCGISMLSIMCVLSAIFNKLEVQHQDQLLKEGNSVRDYE